jgi:hypothetical protein
MTSVNDLIELSNEFQRIDWIELNTEFHDNILIVISPNWPGMLHCAVNEARIYLPGRRDSDYDFVATLDYVSNAGLLISTWLEFIFKRYLKMPFVFTYGSTLSAPCLNTTWITRTCKMVFDEPNTCNPKFV